MQTIVIIGSGIAGHTLAKEIRKKSQTAQLHLYTQDSGDYYYKPNLSTALAKQKAPQDLIMHGAQSLAQDLNLILHSHTSVTECDLTEKMLRASDGIQPYDQLIFATGAKPIPLPKLPSTSDTFQPMTLNSFDDYTAFREKLRAKRTVAIIGAGLVACELAHDLATSGYTVEVIALSKTPLDLWLPEMLGEKLAQALSSLGVIFHFTDTVAAINDLVSPYEIQLQSGKRLKADIVLSAIGLLPNTQLAAHAGIACDKGIVINETGQTNYQQHFALGDCVQYQNEIRLFVQPILPIARVIAHHVFETSPLTITLPVAPIMVKTPCFPIAAVLPKSGADYHWQISQLDDDPIALAYDDMSQLCGYILTGKARQQHGQYSKVLGIARLA